MAGPDLLFPHRHQRRHRTPPRPRRGVGPIRFVTPVMALGFLATLAALQGSPVPPAYGPAPSADRLSARFGFCPSGGGRDCVVDGDTFRFAGEKYRIADIDTPETHPARCAEEAAMGAAATRRLRAWMNAGPFSLEGAGRDTDRYGRKLRIVTRGGASVGAMLVGEGLARPWEGRRRPWC